MGLPTVAEVMSVLDAAYPPSLQSDWDAVGLVCGDPDASVSSILLAVDPVMAVVDESMAERADMVIAHHPLFLRGVHGVAAITPGGRVAHTLISHGIALATAHTNADHASPGVSDALAETLGLVELVPLEPSAGDPAVGAGRIGLLPDEVTLEQFAEHVAAVLPATRHGVRVAGDPQRGIRRVAVCGGSGDAFLDAAARRADAYVTADLRHHRALDHLADGGCALIDVAHWASEWPWLGQAAAVLAAGLAERGSTVSIRVSEIPTDPWTSHVGSDR